MATMRPDGTFKREMQNRGRRAKVHPVQGRSVFVLQEIQRTRALRAARQLAERLKAEPVGRA